MDALTRHVAHPTTLCCRPQPRPDWGGRTRPLKSPALWSFIVHSLSTRTRWLEQVRESGLNRSEIFITTKIYCAGNASGAVAAIESDLQQLGLPQVDLVLIHRPTAYPGHPEQCQNAAQRAATWQGLEQALKAGKTRAIGVSNFNDTELGALLETAKVPPAVNQCQLSVGSHDDATIDFCRAHGITYEAYSPLRGNEMSQQAVKKIAATHGKSGAQVILRWIVQQGHILATSADNTEYLLR